MAIPSSSSLETMGYGGYGGSIMSPTVAKSSITLDTLLYGGYGGSIFYGNPAGGAAPTPVYGTFLLNFI